jgi:hypothetical protein
MLRSCLWGACHFLQRKFTSLDFPLVLLVLTGLSDFYFQKVTHTPVFGTPVSNSEWTLSTVYYIYSDGSFCLNDSIIEGDNNE